MLPPSFSYLHQKKHNKLTPHFLSLPLLVRGSRLSAPFFIFSVFCVLGLPWHLSRHCVQLTTACCWGFLTSISYYNMQLQLSCLNVSECKQRIFTFSLCFSLSMWSNDLHSGVLLPQVSDRHDLSPLFTEHNCFILLPGKCSWLLFAVPFFPSLSCFNNFSTKQS